MSGRIRVGVSSCLLGEKVRYDGGHKRDHFLTDIFGRSVEFVPVCPEYEAGFGTPRETMRLEGDPRAPRLVTGKTCRDCTARMTRWAAGKLRSLEKLDLRGFVFKSASPSCGMERVKVYRGEGYPEKTAAGLFARAFMDRFPRIPAEDEAGLNDVPVRDNFIVRVFAFDRWMKVRSRDPRAAAIIDFHARHKYVLMAHSPSLQKEMGRLVAQSRALNRREFIDRYEELLMEALRSMATVKKNVNVLAHMAGYFRDRCDANEKKELADIIEQYRKERVPLIMPVTLVRHYARKYGDEYLAGQYFLDPDPLELKLRCHA